MFLFPGLFPGYFHIYRWQIFFISRFMSRLFPHFHPAYMFLFPGYNPNSDIHHISTIVGIFVQILLWKNRFSSHPIKRIPNRLRRLEQLSCDTDDKSFQNYDLLDWDCFFAPSIIFVTIVFFCSFVRFINQYVELKTWPQNI